MKQPFPRHKGEWWEQEVDLTMERGGGGDSLQLAVPASRCWITCLTFTIHISCMPMVVAGCSFAFSLYPPVLYCTVLMPVFLCPLLLHCVQSAHIQWHEGPAHWLSVHVVVHAHAASLWEYWASQCENYCEGHNPLCQCPNATACQCMFFSWYL